MSEKNEPRIEIGEVCPPVQSWFFPADPEKKPFPLEGDKENKDGHPAQPS